MENNKQNVSNARRTCFFCEKELAEWQPRDDNVCNICADKIIMLNKIWDGKFCQCLGDCKDGNAGKNIPLKECGIGTFNQQRKLLLAYEEYTSYKVLGKKTPRTSKQMVEDFLTNNYA